MAIPLGSWKAHIKAQTSCHLVEAVSNGLYALKRLIPPDARDDDCFYSYFIKFATIIKILWKYGKYKQRIKTT